MLGCKSHLGTPQLLTDKNQAIVWQATYTPFGTASISNEQITNNIRFPGQYFDSETNLHYNYQRYYNPELGRYITSDPIGLEGGINTYGYANANPINNTDPKGLWVPQAIGAVIGVGVEGYNQYQSGNFNAARLAVAAGTGALGGFGTTFTKAAAYGATANLMNDAHRQYTDKGSCGVDYGQLGRSALLGGVGGGLGNRIGAVGRNIYRPVDVIGKQLNKIPPAHYGNVGSAVGAVGGGVLANQ